MPRGVRVDSFGAQHVSGLSIAKSLELHLMHPGLTSDDVVAGCSRAADLHLASVLVAPVHVAAAARELAGRDTRVCAAIGFPWGSELRATRLHALDQARSSGADSMTIAVDHSLMIAGDVRQATDELVVMLEHVSWASLVSTRGHGTITIAAETMRIDCPLFASWFAACAESPAALLQTSTGFDQDPITEDHIRLIRDLLPSDLGITAVGHIATLDDAAGLINAGATRIGTRSALAIAERERALREERLSR